MTVGRKVNKCFSSFLSSLATIFFDNTKEARNEMFLPLSFSFLPPLSSLSLLPFEFMTRFNHRLLPLNLKHFCLPFLFIPPNFDYLFQTKVIWCDFSSFLFLFFSNDTKELSNDTREERGGFKCVDLWFPRL